MQPTVILSTKSGIKSLDFGRAKIGQMVEAVPYRTPQLAVSRRSITSPRFITGTIMGTTPITVGHVKLG